MPQNISSLTSYFTKAVEQFQTTLSLTAAYNAVTLNLTTLNGTNSSYVNGDLACFAIEPGTSKQNVVYGTINTASNTLTGCVWTEGGANSHPTGSVVADITSATDWNAMITGLLKQHKQSGAHSAITADSLVVAGAASGAGLINLLYPVGCLYTETTGVNPATTFGFGTWLAFGAGRVMVGAGTSDQAFAAGATGGVSKQSLAHTHDSYLSNGQSSGQILPIRPDYIPGASLVGVNSAATGPVQTAALGSVELWKAPTLSAGSTTQNNLQPYVVVYMWNRTA